MPMFVYKEMLEAIERLSGRKRTRLLRAMLESLAASSSEKLKQGAAETVDILLREPDFVIEKNVPIASNGSSGSNLRNIMKDMQKNDSIVLDMVHYNQVWSPAKLEKIKILRRKINSEEFRIWRIK